MIDCGTARQTLRNNFDTGIPLESGVEPHLVQCGGCRAFAARLQALDVGLREESMEELSPGFVRRIQLRSVAPPAPEPERLLVPVCVAMTVILTAIALGRWLPIRWDVSTMMHAVPNEWLVVDWEAFRSLPTLQPGHAMLYSVSELARYVSMQWEAYRAIVALPASLVPGVLAATVTALVLFNIILARRERTGHWQ